MNLTMSFLVYRANIKFCDPQKLSSVIVMICELMRPNPSSNE